MKKSRFYFLLFVAAFMFSGCTAIRRYEDRESITSVLNRMNEACRTKEIKMFMNQISPDYDGKRDELKIAVENDFAGFKSISYTTEVLDVVKNNQTGLYSVSVSYIRQAVTTRDGDYDKIGRTVLIFALVNEQFKLVSMPSPRLYGLIAP